MGGRFRPESTHGYLGAIILSSAVLKSHPDYFSKDWDKVESSKLCQALQAAIAAIAIHNFQYKMDRKRINLESNFYAYLLYLIDNIQDWSRSSPADVDKWPKYWLSSFERKDENLRIDIEYHLYHDSWTNSMEKRVNNGLLRKKEAVASLQPPSDPLGMTIAVKYNSSRPKINETIKHTF